MEDRAIAAGAADLVGGSLIWVVRQRANPQFFIVDGHGTTKGCSEDMTGSAALAASQAVIHRLIAQGRLASTRFEELDDECVLRIVPLYGEGPESYSIFLERITGRDLLQSIDKRFDVTRREADVLRLLVRGFSNGQIAKELFISEGTVGDHVKGLFRKTRTNKRSELVARVLHYDGFDLK